MSKEPKRTIASKKIIELVRWTVQLAYKADRTALIILISCIIFLSILPFVESFLAKVVIDELVEIVAHNNSYTDILKLAILFSLAVELVQTILWSISSYAEKRQYMSLDYYLTNIFVRKISKLDTEHFENSKTNNLIKKVDDSVPWKPREFISRAAWLLGDLVRIIASIVIVLNFSFLAFLLVVITALPNLVINFKLGRSSWGIWDASTETRRTFWATKSILTWQESIMELRIFQSRNYLIKLLTDTYDSFFQKEKSVEVRRATISSLVGNLSTLGIIIFWIIAIDQTIKGEISIGLLTFYTSSIREFSRGLSNLFRNISNHYEDLFYLKDIKQFFQIENKIKSGSEAIDSAQPPLIEFRNVDFSYPTSDRVVLDNFSLTIQPGDKIALVGANGAGKSTIIKLLSRLYDVNGGEILINGTNIRQVDLSQWYKSIGILFQSFIRFDHLTVSKNIRLGDVTKSMNKQEVEQAAIKAQADEFVNKFPKKYQQILDPTFKGGITPSGGQWQKLALARAFYRDAPILVLDEPTAAIDADSEYAIFQRLYEFSANKTVIIISHRFSTVRNADKIYVIDEGKIIESGSHEELMQLKGKYFTSFSKQAKGYQ